MAEWAPETVEAKRDQTAKARAALAAKREAAKAAADLPEALPGRRLTDEARARLEDEAAILPTNKAEYDRQLNAATALKATEKRVCVRVVRAVRRGKLHISGDDLADGAPGSMGEEFAIGEEVYLTPTAAVILRAQGWVE